nr:hypothetical protein [Tanacetum cinerariifolium]
MWDTAYWGFLGARICRISLMDTAYWSSEWHGYASSSLMDTAYWMDDPNITMKEYIRLKEEKAQKRRKTPKKVTAIDLFYLCSMDRGASNVSYLLAQYLFRHAHHFSLIGDDWAWVDQDTKSQPIATATAPSGDEDAPDVDEGAHVISAPIHVPPPPLPATGKGGYYSPRAHCGSCFSCSGRCENASPTRGGYTRHAKQLLGVPIQEELTALRFRVDIAEAESASLRARIKTTEAIEKITHSQERRARMEMERQLASIQESQ